MKVASMLLSELSFFLMHDEEPSNEKIRNLISIDKELVKNRIDDSAHKSQRSDYVKLLAFTNLKIQEDLFWLLNAIKNHDSYIETTSWVFFLRFSKLDSDLKISCEFLESIITNRTINPRIREIALRRYTQLSQKRSYRIDEQKLELPLK